MLEKEIIENMKANLVNGFREALDGSQEGLLMFQAIQQNSLDVAEMYKRAHEIGVSMGQWLANEADGVHDYLKLINFGDGTTHRGDEDGEVPKT